MPEDEPRTTKVVIPVGTAIAAANLVADEDHVGVLAQRARHFLDWAALWMADDSPAPADWLPTQSLPAAVAETIKAASDAEIALVRVGMLLGGADPVVVVRDSLPPLIGFRHPFEAVIRRWQFRAITVEPFGTTRFAAPAPANIPQRLEVTAAEYRAMDRCVGILERLAKGPPTITLDGYALTPMGAVAVVPSVRDRLAVTIDPPTITLDGRAHRVPEQAARFVRVLLDAAPGSMTYPDMKRRDPALGENVTHVRARIPTAIMAVIEETRGWRLRQSP